MVAGVPPSGSGCQPTASAADASSLSGIPNAFAALQSAIQSDPDYAWGWFCNIAVPIIDASQLSHEEAETAAANVMAVIFDCDITKHQNFKGVKSWAQDYHEIRVAAERAEDAQGGDA